MGKLKFFCFLVLLVVLPYRSASQECPEWSKNLVNIEDYKVEGVEDDGVDGFEPLEFPFREGEKRKKVISVDDDFGAVGDGIADDTEAFVKAWKEACSTSNSVFLVPEERIYLVNATKFKGPCDGKIVIQIDGTIVAQDDPKNWDPKNPRIWLGFYNLRKAVFQGNGIIDGSGKNWWAASCKRNKTNRCKGAPTALTIDASSSVKVKGLTIQNSPQMNFVISQSESVCVTDVRVSAPEDSPNTDGIHITESTNVVLQNSKIGTGDDCISIVNGSSNITMKNIYCGPGHGISIGSLGKNNSTGIVEKVVVDTAFLQGTTNGLRIKTWQGGSGYVKSVVYQNVRMEEVSNPIIIDQFYCDLRKKTCQNQTSAVEISQIIYQNISGTSRSRLAMKFACSDTVPCKHIIVDNVQLESRDDKVEAFCNSALGLDYGNNQPSAECLSYTEKDMKILQEKEAEATPRNRDRLIHTEL